MTEAPPPTEYLDGCTLFPDTVADNVIVQCCDAHDVAYWYAQTAAEKFSADAELFACVAATGDWFMVVVAAAMFVGVATGGTYFWMTRDKRWKKNETGTTDI